jgi:anti-sigma B factor antagonist
MERPAHSEGGAPAPGAGTRRAGSPPAYAKTETPLRDALRPRGPVRLGVSERPQRDSILVRVDGELDLLTAPRLATRVDHVIRECAGNVVLDLREVDFIDSAGLQVLLGARRRLTRGSRGLVIVCDDGPVRRVIEAARLLDALGVVAGVDQ